MKANALAALFFGVAIALQGWTLNEVVSLKVQLAQVQAQIKEHTESTRRPANLALSPQTPNPIN